MKRLDLIISAIEDALKDFATDSYDNDYHGCCGADLEVGHTADCKLAQALAAARELRELDYEPEQSILICSNCGADRSKEACKGERTYCPFAGHAQQDYGFDRTANHMAGEYVDTAEQEPVAWMHPDGKNYRGFKSPLTTFMTNDWTPLYAAPTKREWVGLTDEEILSFVAYEPHPLMNRTSIVHAVQAKLREKNG